MNKDDTFTSCLGILSSIAVVVVLGMLINGWALSVIWNWFIPRLFGLTSLTIFQAIGVGTVLQLFTGTNRVSNSSEDTSKKSYTTVFIESTIKAVLVPILTVLISYIILQLAF